MLWIWLVIASIVVIFTVVAIFLWLLVKTISDRVKEIEKTLRIIHSDLTVISSCQVETVERDHHSDRRLDQYIRTTDSRLEILEQRQRQLTRRQDEHINTNEPNDISYGAAIRLAHKGADVEQLVTAFGLSRGEAELIAALHRAQNEQS